MDRPMFVTFVIAWAGVVALGALLFQTELLGKRLDARLRLVRRELAGERPL
jgi:hypothetical protein